MDEQLEFLRLVVSRLNASGIAYMLTGSMAMSVYSAPRMTRDIDFVIECRPEDAPRIAALFGDDCYVDEEAVRQAILAEGTFNIIHSEWIVKADFIVRKEDEYRRLEFRRRRTVDLHGSEICVVAPEDLVLSELCWSKNGDSDLQLRDAGAVARNTVGLDWGYVREWASRLGVSDLLKEIEQ